MNEETISLELTREESGVIVQALAECPFKLVFELIGKINHQAQPLYKQELEISSTVIFSLSPAEFSCCLKALGDLPYNRVHFLLNNLKAQLCAQKQIEAA
jgi:hypothetical protein